MYQKSSGGTRWLRAAAIGGGASVLAALILCMLAAGLIANGAIPLDAMGAVALVICLLSSLSGSFVGAKRAGERRLPAAMLAAGEYLLLMLCVKGLAFRGEFENGVYLLAAVCAGGLVAGVLAAKKKRRRK